MAAHERAAVLLEQAAELRKAAMTVFEVNGRPDLAEHDPELEAGDLRKAAGQRARATWERGQQAARAPPAREPAGPGDRG